MDILRAQFLFSCRKLKNGTFYYDNYDINEKVELQKIAVSGIPYYDSVSFENSFYCI
jgi:hypothetical protein